MTAINRPLTGDERSLINMLAVRVVAHQTGSDDQTAVLVLDQLAGEGEVFLREDPEVAYLEVCGKVIVSAERDWLAFHAEHPEAIDVDRHGRWIK
jgi:hypothetical protein